MNAPRDLEFYRAPPPPGRSRESTIVLDSQGDFHHDGSAFAHAGLRDAMHTWIGRHPDDRRFILDNGYDWSYFTVEDVPYFVRHVGSEAELTLSDGSVEPLALDETYVGPHDALYTLVKRSAPLGPYWAKFTRHAQTELAPFLCEIEDPSGNAAEGAMGLRVGNRAMAIGKRETFK